MKTADIQLGMKVRVVVGSGNSFHDRPAKVVSLPNARTGYLLVQMEDDGTEIGVNPYEVQPWVSGVVTQQQRESNRLACQHKVEWCMNKAAERGVILLKPEVVFSSNTKSAGRAHYGQNLIMINEQLLAEHFNEQVNETIPHEVAHLIVHKLFRNAEPHGWVWQQVMQEWFGVKPNRLHHMDTRNVGRGKGLKLDLNSLFDSMGERK